MKAGFAILVIFVSCLLGIFYLLVGSPETFTLWQLQGSNDRHMMSYVIQDAQRSIYVVDGGRSEDAQELKKFLRERGDSVKGWFITHPHNDHVGALTVLLEEEEDRLVIKEIYGSFLEESFMEVCHKNRVSDYRSLWDAIEKREAPFTKTSAGMVLGSKSLKVEVLSDINPEIANNCMNNSSIVYRFSDAQKSVLFLGDLGVQAGNKLLKGPFAERLDSDFVQMAHHGQRGVGRNVYEKIKPIGCLWPTPRWLWENDNGKGYNSGPWDTLRVRKWMEELGVTSHYVMADGLQTIR